MGEKQGPDVAKEEAEREWEADALDPEGGSCDGDEEWGEKYKTPKGEQSRE